MLYISIGITAGAWDMSALQRLRLLGSLLSEVSLYTLVTVATWVCWTLACSYTVT